MPSRFEKRTVIGYLLMVIVAACDGSQGSSSKDLTRALAKQKIGELLKSPFEVTVALPPVVEIAHTAVKTWPQQQLEASLNRLVSDGLITLGEPKRAVAGMPVYTLRVALTEKGKQFLASKEVAGQAGDKQRVVVMCVMDFHEITGIQQNAQKTEADVHLTIKVSKVSGFAVLNPDSPCAVVLNGKGEGPEKNLLSQVMKMVLFDDGWRVVPR